MNTTERRQGIQKIKAGQKSLGLAIRHMKASRKGGWTNYKHECELARLQSLFRHRHVAWSILRGRQLEKIDSGEMLNMSTVNMHVQDFQKLLGHQEEAA